MSYWQAALSRWTRSLSAVGKGFLRVKKKRQRSRIRSALVRPVLLVPAEAVLFCREGL